MLSINWDDVARLVSSLRPQLIAIGVILLLAIVVTIAVRTLNVPVRKLARSTTWVVAIISVAASVMGMLYGGLQNTLNLASGSGTLTDATIESAKALNTEISDEGMVLLKNENSTLPLKKGTALNTFGWASTNPVYGGTGSGSMNASYDLTTLLEGLDEAGFSTNTKLTDFYTAYRADRPVLGMFSDTDLTLPEPAASTYPSDLLEQAREFSDTSIVTISRSGGEGYDLPSDVNAAVAGDTQYQYTDNSTDYKDFADGQGYLSLTHSEKDMIALAEKTSDKVIVLYNGANAFELGDLQDDPNIDAIIWAIPPGQVGFSSLGKILDGDVNPSAKTPDAFARDLSSTPAAKNFGVFTYSNMTDYAYDMTFANRTYTPTFANYVEGIYVGYRWWETAAAEGVVDYDKQVVYPFGYGLSYTSFEQTMGDVSYTDGVVSFDVTVTNTGSVAGKDVVEAYYNPPYTNGGIEKAAANLVAYEKTDLLEPGASQTVTISFNDDDMASYDSTTAKAWVLEAGDYKVSIRKDSHEIIDEKTVNVAETITYNTADNTHNGDQTVATNQFDAAAGDVTYLSRADKFANYDEATAAPASMEMSAEHQAAFIANSNYDPTKFDNASDEMPTTGAKNGLVLGDMYGLAYDDPKWDELLDQLSVDDMDTLIANGGYGTPAVASVGKVRTTDVDGPASLNNNFTGVGSIGLPAATSVAATFNKDLAHQFGTAIGTMAHDMNVAGWYAPATNIHRSAYSGRNFEYFSEDPVLAGEQVAQEIQGAKELGVYAFMKHFALNDQETNRTHMISTWSNEQAMREIYLRPFETAVKDGGTGAVMSSFNYIGTTYAGALPELQQTVLRDEWGFRGMVLTDYFAGYGYQNADQLTRNGGDVMLATLDLGVNHVQDKSATGVIAMRNAAHNILYTAANSWLYENGQPEVQRAAWEYIAWVALGAVLLGALALEFLAVKRFRTRKASTVEVEAASAETSDQE